MTLDRVAQAPDAREEDTSGGFRQGGWHLRHFGDTSRAWVVERYAGAGRLSLQVAHLPGPGRYWPHAPREEQAIAEPLNTRPKDVASTTLADPLEWQNSKVPRSDVAEAVAALKRQDGGDLLVVGSTHLVQTMAGTTWSTTCS